jgi:hypothetical protein
VTTRAKRRAALGARLFVTLIGVTLLAGCLGKPKIEDRWTRVDLVQSSLAPNQPLVPGVAQPISVHTAITYRSIITGVAVAELRASGTLGATDVAVRPDASRLQMAQDIDRILANSVSVGRATRAITGWDHLIQDIDFNFNAVAPATMDSAGVPRGAPAGLFLLCYLGSGEKVERADGSDTLIVTPFISSDREILPIGMALGVSGGGTP